MAALVLKGGRLVDGSGSPGVVGDLVVEDGYIVAVGDVDDVDAEVVEVDGLVVAPGFIDMHAHSDIQAIAGTRHDAKIHQGFTTEVIGQDGLGYAPVRDADMMNALRAQIAAWNGDPDLDWGWRTTSEYLDALRGRTKTNLAFLLGHGTLRMFVAPGEDGPLTETQTGDMLELAEQGMREGAMGLSLGLTYTPGAYASTEELVALCRVVAAHGGYLSPHHRGYGKTALASYSECVEIARRSGIHLHLTHAVMNYAPNKGRAGKLLDLVESARAEGVSITMDSYPYIAGSTYLAAFLPSWAHRPDPDEQRAILQAPQTRSRIQHEMDVIGSDGAHGVPMNWEAVVVVGGADEGVRAMAGQSIADLARARDQSPFDVYCHILELDGTRAGCLNFAGHEENVREIMRSPHQMIGTDAILVGERPHPRGWGTAPRFLGHYVRGLGVVELEEAVRKMTALPASVLGLSDRGLLRPGYRADVVCFDPDTVIDRATYDDPMRYPEGIEHVMVNGTFVVRAASANSARPGTVLTGPATEGSPAGSAQR